MKILFAAAAILLLNVGAAQEAQRSVVFTSPSSEQFTTGNLAIDLFSQKEMGKLRLQQEQDIHATVTTRKSPWLAAGLSAVVPGAGEFYAESYWKAAAFFAVDVAAWLIAYSNDKKGDDQTSFFQNYADQNWDPVRYAEFSLLNFLDAAPANRRGAIQRDLIRNRNASSPGERIDWVLMNEFEDYISRSERGRFYSHRLPGYGEQQYFELIGKYQQYYHGWNDADTSLTSYEQIEQRLKSSDTKFEYYSGERGKANDFYSRATTFVTIAIVNHVLSAIDAAWTASLFNKRLHASMQMQTIPTQFGYTQIPVTRLEYSF